jgi:hypothetical protein
VSLIIDTAQAVASLRSAIAVMFQLDPERVEIRTSGSAIGVTPVLVLEVHVDGALAGEDVEAFVTGLLTAARTLAEMKR